MKNSFSIKTNKKSRRDRAHPRTLKTYQNKINKLKSVYRNHPKIKTKYPTFEDRIKVLKVKPVGKVREKINTYISSTKDSVWGN
jgi:hypothetical protein